MYNINIMKYIIIIFILFSFIVYYNQILSKKNILISKKEKENKYLQKKLNKIKNKKPKYKQKDEFILNNTEQNKLNDSLFSDDNCDNVSNDINNDNDNDNNEDAETFALDI